MADKYLVAGAILNSIDAGQETFFHDTETEEILAVAADLQVNPIDALGRLANNDKARTHTARMLSNALARVALRRIQANLLEGVDPAELPAIHFAPQGAPDRKGE